MNRQVIPRNDVAKEIAETITALARDIDHDRNAAIKIAANRLSVFLRSDEIFVLLKIISEDRVQCGTCGITVPETRASGAWCLTCACKMRRITEEECAQ